MEPMDVFQIYSSDRLQKKRENHFIIYNYSKMQAKRIAIFDEIRKKYKEEVKDLRLKDLLGNEERCKAFVVESDGMVMDYSRQRMTLPMLERLVLMVEELGVFSLVEKMFTGVTPP
jgi:hypothetical protein